MSDFIKMAKSALQYIESPKDTAKANAAIILLERYLVGEVPELFKPGQKHPHMISISDTHEADSTSACHALRAIDYCFYTDVETTPSNVFWSLNSAEKYKGKRRTYEKPL